MAEKPLVCLVFFEGLARTVISSAVLDHAREIAQLGIARFEIWAFCPTRELYRQSVDRLQESVDLAQCRVRLLRGMRPAVPFSVLINGQLVRSAMETAAEKPDFIHARADYATAACVFASSHFGIPLLWDCRSDSVAESEERLSSRSNVPDVVKRMKVSQDERVLKRAASYCHGAVFVSHALKSLMEQRLGTKQSVVVPCAASEDRFYFDEIIRATTREELGYEDRHHVYVFSGGMQKYQCFDQTVAMFRAIAERNPSARLLVLTPYIEAARAELKDMEGSLVRIVDADYRDVNKYLNAADIAFMLREHKPINRVASPTKFSEYCLCGLQVVMNDSVADAFEIAKILKNLILPEEMSINRLAYDRAAVARIARGFVGRRTLSDRYRTIYGALLAGHPSGGAR